MGYNVLTIIIQIGALILPLVFANALVEREDTFILTNYLYFDCIIYDRNVILAGEVVVTDGDTRLSLTKCAIACAAYSVFSVAGTRCVCSNAPRAGTSIDEDLICKSACAGGSTQPCGASSALRIYRKRTASYVPSPDAQVAFYQGCLGPPGGGTYYTGQTELTLGRCQNICEGYRFYGLSDTYCICSEDWETPRELDDSCQLPCPGNPDQICGGFNLVSIYTTQASCQIPGTRQVVQNPSFELGTAYWSVKTIGSGKMTWSARGDEVVPAGTKVARIDLQNTDTSSTFRMSQTILTCPGLSYTWNHKSRQLANSGCTFKVLKDLLGLSGAQTSGTSYVANTYNFIATAGSSLMTIEIKCIGSRAVKSQFIDDIRVSQL